MAPFEARLASAKAMARRAPIRVSDFERGLGTRYTIDTVRALQRAYPQRPLHLVAGRRHCCRISQWSDCRDLARMVPIAVIARPGYDRRARRGARDGLAAAVRPTLRPGDAMDGVECTGDHLPSPAARPDLRHRLTRARPQLASTVPGRRRPFRAFGDQPTITEETTCPDRATADRREPAGPDRRRRPSSAGPAIARRRPGAGSRLHPARRQIEHRRPYGDRLGPLDPPGRVDGDQAGRADQAGIRPNCADRGPARRRLGADRCRRRYRPLVPARGQQFLQS